jgi:hypothetical protein
MDSLRVRAYNVRFGDAVLVSVPDRGPGGVTVRHLLIDVGNVLAGSGGEDEVFEPVIENVLEVLDGRPLDLYVMTHEHMDHVQGLLWAERRGLEVRATHAWLTASAQEGYYERHPEAKKKKLAMEDAYQRIALHLAAAGGEPDPRLAAMMLNNNPRATADCVAHLRTVGDTTTYVSRATGLAGTHPFAEAKLELWGPEEDTSVYYGRFRPMGLGLGAAAAAGGAGGEAPPRDPLPPPGVDAGAFYDLVGWRRRGIFDNVRMIDKAANDTSVVFTLEWRGWRLLFPGDAEERAWKEMGKRGVLAPVHFLKVGHHGSHNGTPEGERLDAILPPAPPDGRPRTALVSTHEGTYNDVPDPVTLGQIGERCRVVRIGAEDDPLFTDVEFPDPGE